LGEEMKIKIKNAVISHNNQLKIRRRNDGGVYEDARPDGNVGEHDRIGFGAIELGGGEKIKYNK